MPWKLVITETAEEDLKNLLSGFRKGQRPRVVQAIRAACATFAANPPFKSGRWGTPSFTLEFKLDDVRYYWAATYRLTLDEAHIAITHIFRFGL